VHNPHFALAVKRKCKLLLVLVQSPSLSAKKKKEWDAIGLYINKGNGMCNILGILFLYYALICPDVYPRMGIPSNQKGV